MKPAPAPHAPPSPSWASRPVAALVLILALSLAATLPAAAGGQLVDHRLLSDRTDPMFYEGFEVGQPEIFSNEAAPTAAANTEPELQLEVTVPPGSGPTELEAALAGYTGPVTSANARFVVAGYQRLIGRQADTAGLDFHGGRIAGGGDRSRLGFTYALLFSPEGSRNEVRRAYTSILHRSPDTAGEDYWTQHLQGHGVSDLQVLLYASDEYVSRAGGTEEAWIRKLYQDTLGRTADAGGLGYWLERRQVGVPRVLVAAGIQQSPEAKARRAVSYYQDVLGRTPSETEVAGTVAALATSDDRMVRARMFASDEAFEPYLRAAWS